MVWIVPQKASEGIGERLAHYRRLAGLSAQQLSDQLRGSISRGVIANIESGRKTDVSVDQLLALSYQLGISPVVLALPIDQPNRLIRISEGARGTASARTGELIDWWLNVYGRAPGVVAPHAAAALSESILDRLEVLRIASRHLGVIQDALDRVAIDPTADPEFEGALRKELQSAEAEVTEAQRRLEALGVDLSSFPEYEDAEELVLWAP